MKASGVILAGGQSRRMGRDKASVIYQGKTLLEQALGILRELLIQEVFISGRVGQDYSSSGCRVLHDLEPGLGPLSGIERALRESTSGLVLVLPVDLPAMDAECLRGLLRQCDSTTGAVAVLNGEMQPLVAAYPKRCHTYAVFNMARAQYAVKQFAENCLQEHAVRRFRVPPRYRNCFKNCNAPADLRELRSLETINQKLVQESAKL